MTSSRFVPRPWMLVLVFLLVYLGTIYWLNEGDSKVFVTLGSCFSQCAGNDGENCGVPEDASSDEQLAIEGYDGQFNYYIARNPADSVPCIDVPAYRYQRILLPILGYVFSAAGNVRLIPWIFVLVNGLALLISTRLLEDLISATDHSIWFALGYGLFFGVLVAVRLSTSEPLAYSLVIGAIWAHQKENRWLTFICLGLAGFAKETTGIFTAGFLLWFVVKRRRRDALWLVLIAGVPFLLWQIFLYGWLGAFGLGSGGAKTTGFEIIPFGGIVDIWRAGGLQEFLVRGVIFMGAVAVLPSVWGLLECIRDFRQVTGERRVNLYTCLLLTNAVSLFFVPFSTYREYIAILRFLPGMVLMTVLFSAERGLGRSLRYSTCWVFLLSFVIVG